MTCMRIYEVLQPFDAINKYLERSHFGVVPSALQHLVVAYFLCTPRSVLEMTFLSRNIEFNRMQPILCMKGLQS